MTENEITNLKFGKWLVLFLVIPSLLALFFIGLILEVVHAAAEKGAEHVADSLDTCTDIIKKTKL